MVHVVAHPGEEPCVCNKVHLPARSSGNVIRMLGIHQQLFEDDPVTMIRSPPVTIRMVASRSFWARMTSHPSPFSSWSHLAWVGHSLQPFCFWSQQICCRGYLCLWWCRGNGNNEVVHPARHEFFLSASSLTCEFQLLRRDELAQHTCGHNEFRASKPSDKWVSQLTICARSHHSGHVQVSFCAWIRKHHSNPD